jgi:hypothetical protein
LGKRIGRGNFSQLACFARIPVDGLAFSRNKDVTFVNTTSSCSGERFAASNRAIRLIAYVNFYYSGTYEQSYQQILWICFLATPARLQIYEKRNA